MSVIKFPRRALLDGFTVQLVDKDGHVSKVVFDV